VIDVATIKTDLSNGPRPVDTARLLCLGHLPHDIVHLHRVAERAHAEMGLEPHFLVTAPDRLMDGPREYLAAHHLNQVDAGVEHAAHYYPPALRTPSIPEPLRGFGLGRVVGHLASNPVTRYRGLRQANLQLARHILDTVKPAAVLATVDACHDTFLAEATRRGIPTIYMQVALWGDRKFYRDLWADDERAKGSGQAPGPGLKGRVDKLVRRGFGLHNRPAWRRESSRIAVLGPYWAELLSRGGIPRRRIAVTGNPHCDEVHAVKSGGGRWRELYERLGLPGETRYLLHCREYFGRFNGWSGLDGEPGEREIIETLKAASPRTPIVVKMHPRDTGREYDLVRSIDPSVIAVGDVPLIELLARSRLMVTMTSTTQLWSVALDRPTISAFFWKGLDHFERATAFAGVERVFTPEELRASVDRSLNDSTYQDVWRRKRMAFVDEMLVVDGHSIERLVQLLREPFSDLRLAS
jgi:Capsule polysaccharide biosynthesis protein